MRQLYDMHTYTTTDIDIRINQIQYTCPNIIQGQKNDNIHEGYMLSIQLNKPDDHGPPDGMPATSQLLLGVSNN